MRLGDLRAELSSSCHRRSTARAIAGMVRDLLLYGVPVSGALLLGNPVTRVLCGVVAGGAVAIMFVWAHDAAHGALFLGRRRSDALGTLMMLPSLQPYRLWQHGHNRVHHGF